MLDEKDIIIGQRDKKIELKDKEITSVKEDGDVKLEKEKAKTKRYKRQRNGAVAVSGVSIIIIIALIVNQFAHQ